VHHAYRRCDSNIDRPAAAAILFRLVVASSRRLGVLYRGAARSARAPRWDRLRARVRMDDSEFVEAPSNTSGTLTVERCESGVARGHRQGPRNVMVKVMDSPIRKLLRFPRMPSDVRVARTKWKREQPVIGRTAFSNDQIAESHRVTMANTAASTRHMKSSANRPAADKSASRSRRIRGRQILDSSRAGAADPP
jgi:hypothetical protein